MFLVSCSDSSSISSRKEKEIKETIDLVLSYEKGYDETMKKHMFAIIRSTIHYI